MPALALSRKPLMVSGRKQALYVHMRRAVGQTDIAEEDAVTTDQQRHREKKASRHHQIEVERLGHIHKRGITSAHIDAAEPSAKRIALPNSR